MTLLLGWVARSWKGPKVRCVTCNRRIRSGVTHVHDTADPPRRAMCFGCYRLIRGAEPGG